MNAEKTTRYFKDIVLMGRPDYLYDKVESGKPGEEVYRDSPSNHLGSLGLSYYLNHPKRFVEIPEYEAVLML